MRPSEGLIALKYITHIRSRKPTLQPHHIATVFVLVGRIDVVGCHNETCIIRVAISVRRILWYKKSKL